jgi:hypothetical protein
LEVIVADNAAGDARGAGPDLVGIEHDDVAVTQAAVAAQTTGQMPCRRQAVDASADDDESGGSWW